MPDTCVALLFAFAFSLAVVLGPVALCVLLTVPAWLAVRRLIARRFAAPLQRGKLEALLVAGGALAGACSSVLFARAFGPAVAGTRGSQLLLLLIAPPFLGLIPCAAGELLAGESETPGLALSSSIGVAYVLGFGGFGLEGAGAFVEPVVAAQLAAAGGAALGGAGMYFGMRGAAVAPAPPEAVALLRFLAEGPVDCGPAAGRQRRADLGGSSGVIAERRV